MAGARCARLRVLGVTVVGTEKRCSVRHRSGRALVFRGSKRRVRKLRMRGNGSADVGWVIVWIVLLAALLLPRLIRSQLNASEQQGNGVTHIEASR